MNTQDKVIQVALFRGIENELSYLVSEPLASKVGIGSLILVPLRGSSSPAIVVDECSLSDFKNHSGFKLRKIYSLVQEEKVLNKELLKLAYWMRDYYGCSLQTVFESMIPAVVRAGKSALEAKEIKLARLPTGEELSKMERRAPTQFKVCKFMIDHNSSILKSALLRVCEVTSASVDSLIKKGILEQSDKIIGRSAYDDELAKCEVVSGEVPVLNDEQSVAFADISADLDSKSFKTRLLYGVTGSGKTEVYIRAMNKVLSEGGTCVYLVPEISLTPQTVGRLRSRLGKEANLVVWHSNLTNGQRLDAWRALASGKSKVVVGARSCIFAPLENVKLIIVDEEHDSAYKQDKNPRYNARDIAVLRAKFSECLCILGSATPSLESLYNADLGKYEISRIRERVDGSRLPSVFILDMKREKHNATLSNLLIEKIGQRLDNGEQVILFLNRRGYSKIFECQDCGWVEQCPHCSVSMTWHKRENLVKCHICGFTKEAPLLCANCNSLRAKWHGDGTQKIEETVSKLFPSARIGRMDRDTMKRRDNYRKVLGDFRAGRLDILIGTQMIAKGLDFPRVTLVGIINADVSLRMPDFRAAERTYQLIVQVAGRAGRGENAGEVIVQTMTPEAEPIQYAKRDDMESFLESEMESRKEYGYPPYMRLIRHIFRGRNPDKLAFFAEEWAKIAERELGSVCVIRGPSPAPLEKSEDFYRWHIWYFCKSVRPVMSTITRLRKDFEFPPDIDDFIDVDPMSMM